MSPWWLWTAPAACWIVAPGLSRTMPNDGPLELWPDGALPVNVETMLTAPDTVLPETLTPVVPVRATLIVGSDDAPLAIGVIASATALPAAATAATIIVNRCDMWVAPRLVGCQRDSRAPIDH